MSKPKSLAESDTVAAGVSGIGLGSTPNVNSTPSLPSGPQQLAGRYELLSLIGVGGMGAVYRAKDLELDEIVALKMLRRELLQDPTILARFRQEVKLARRVTHKNVARTYDISEHEGEKFLTMEFVEGESLAARLERRGRMPLAEVVELTESICAGLSAAHAAGIVHRDLKPDNVLLAKDGRVVLTDFGIARGLGDLAGAIVKTMGIPLGTPAYMAPEQVEGARDIDARADIYALGAMLYELLTGERPWDGESVYAVAAKRLVHPPPDPRAKHAELPDAAAKLTMRCMARKREDRYASAAEVAGVLAGLTLPAATGRSMPPPARSITGVALDTAGKTVAVLPFRNGGPADDEYLADGLTDDLIDNLSMTKGLKVRSRGVVMAWKGVDKDPREVGASLGVQVVVEGSVRRASDRLRVNARVVSVADGFQLWAKRFDCPASEFLAVGDEMVKAVADALTVTSQVPARAAPTDPRAVDLYLRARHEYFKGWRGVLPHAIDLFEQALKRAPDDPMILSGYSMALARRFGYDETESADGDGSKSAAERALAAAPHLGEARIALATYFFNQGDYAAAAREARRGLASSPSLGDAHDLCGRLLSEAGALEEGIARLRAAIAFEPRLHTANWYLARALLMHGEVEEADRILAVPPDDASIAPPYWLLRARLALWQHDLAHASRWVKELETRGDLPAGARLLLAMLSGKPVSAEELRSIAAVRSPRRRAFYWQMHAEAHAFQRNAGAALDAIAEADSARLVDLAWLDFRPLFEPFRQDPRFQTLRASVARRAEEVVEILRAPPAPP